MKIEAGKIYRTRGGKRAEIYDIRLRNSNGSLVTFPAKGYVFTTTVTGRVRRYFHIWKLDGKHVAFGEDSHDLIEEIIE